MFRFSIQALAYFWGLLFQWLFSFQSICSVLLVLLVHLTPLGLPLDSAGVVYRDRKSFPRPGFWCFSAGECYVEIPPACTLASLLSLCTKGDSGAQDGGIKVFSCWLIVAAFLHLPTHTVALWKVSLTICYDGVLPAGSTWVLVAPSRRRDIKNIRSVRPKG